MARYLTEEEAVEYNKLLDKHPSATTFMWSYKMLQALDNGVKERKWFSLKDKIAREDTLKQAYILVEKNEGSAGIDKESIHLFEKNYEQNLKKLEKDLEQGTYQPLPVKRVYIDKPGSKEKRPLGIPTVKQRIVENAIKLAIEPIFEKEFQECSYGFRPRRGCKDALRQVDKKLKEGYIYVIDADIKSYFDTINHSKLMNLIRERITDRWLLGYIKRFLKNNIMDGHKKWSPNEGSPQGSVISPLLSNIYLNQLDIKMLSECFEIVRYADDFVVMCETEEDALEGLEIIKTVMSELDLNLHPTKTKIVKVTEEEGFDFLGYHFRLNKRIPRKKSLNSFKDKIRSRSRRNNKDSIKNIIKKLNRSLIGWYNYFKHSNDPYVMKDIDQFTRRRLRSVMAKFNKKYGSHRLSSNRIWPNKFFYNLGLFSLQNTRAKEAALNS